MGTELTVEVIERFAQCVMYMDDLHQKRRIGRYVGQLADSLTKHTRAMYRLCGYKGLRK